MLYCDFHGHSRKNNVFMYGCDGGRAGAAPRFLEHVFPLMLSKNAPDKVGSALAPPWGDIQRVPCRADPGVGPSSPSPAASSRCRRAKRGRAGSSCGGWASPTATPWRRPSAAPRWVRGCAEALGAASCRRMGFQSQRMSSGSWLGKLPLVFLSRVPSRREELALHRGGPQIAGLPPLRHPAGFLRPRFCQGVWVPRAGGTPVVAVAVTLALSRSSSSAWPRCTRCCGGGWAPVGAGAMSPPQTSSPGTSQ